MKMTVDLQLCQLCDLEAEDISLSLERIVSPPEVDLVTLTVSSFSKSSSGLLFHILTVESEICFRNHGGTWTFSVQTLCRKGDLCTYVVEYISIYQYCVTSSYCLIYVGLGIVCDVVSCLYRPRVSVF